MTPRQLTFAVSATFFTRADSGRGLSGTYYFTFRFRRFRPNVSMTHKTSGRAADSLRLRWHTLHALAQTS